MWAEVNFLLKCLLLGFITGNILYLVNIILEQYNKIIGVTLEFCISFIAGSVCFFLFTIYKNGNFAFFEVICILLSCLFGVFFAKLMMTNIKNLLFYIKKHLPN